jgi:hypothetical protein
MFEIEFFDDVLWQGGEVLALARPWIEEPRGERFSRFEPDLRNALDTRGHRNNSSHNGARGIAVAQTADGGPQRLLVTASMMSCRPNAKRHSILRADLSAVA